jgi:hypothetical protein
MHEPSTVNNSYGWSMNGASWETAFGAMIHTVTTSDSNLKACVGFDDMETGWQTYAFSATPAPTCIGYDVFSDNLAQPTGDLGEIQSMIGTAQGLGFETFASEIGAPAWSVAGTSGAGNSYWGVGACNLQGS